MQQSKFAYEPWAVTENGFRPESLKENESVFALGNGYLGMRGNLEEISASDAQTIQGTFINGIFDSEPIVYGEVAYGYAKNHETICNICDAKSVILYADGERLDLGTCSIENHVRTLDLRKGILERGFVWNTRSGAKLSVKMIRIVSLIHQNIAAVKVSAECISGKCSLKMVSEIKPAVIAEGDLNDPRNSAGKDRTLKVLSVDADDNGSLFMQQKTKNTGMIISCAVNHFADADYSTKVNDDSCTYEAAFSLNKGETADFKKTICYTGEKSEDSEKCLNDTADILSGAPEFSKLLEEQENYLDDFFSGAGITIKGDDALLQGLRFNLFHLLMSAGRDGKRNIAAKGLTGEGYEGHYFWDTESYIIPVFLHNEPHVARKLLEYRYSILDNARNRARVMGHSKGGLFAWRTIDGEECSAYFPAGTAQYHINADIAYAVSNYYYTTKDIDFIVKYGAEILVETARLYYDLGFFSDAKGGKFVINCVTGPDEYNVMVNNNTYTNRMAAENLKNAAFAIKLLREEYPDDYIRLCEKIGYESCEEESWLTACENMYYPEPVLGIYPQDDDFLKRKPWPLDTIPSECHPLLIHYHGLNIYRHMVCKQADLILAMTLYGSEYSLEEKKKNFDFYDSVTTHDSSLSMAVFSILAAEIGYVDKSYDYFMSSARLDLDDIHHNTKDGLHMANMAGTVNCITKGFGGMRYENDTLSFRPVCPKQWEGYSFRVRFRGRTIEANISADDSKFSLIEGEGIDIYVNGERVSL